MTKQDLVSGYAVETRDGHVGVILQTGGVSPATHKPELYIAYLDHDYRGGWDPVDSYSPDLRWGGNEPAENDIMKVWGHPYDRSHCLSKIAITRNRELLWTRTEPKKMTVKEICEKLGYDVEIVKDGDSK